MPSKRVASKKSGHRLRMMADQAWRYWLYGHNCPFASDEEEYDCWQLVRQSYLEKYPVGEVDEHGYVECGVFAYWVWEAPDRELDFVEMEGLPAEYAVRHQKLQYLKSWGKVPSETKDRVMQLRADEINTYYQRRVTNSLRGFWYPFPTGVSDEAKAKKWEKIAAEYAAWQALGYIGGDNDGTST